MVTGFSIGFLKMGRGTPVAAYRCAIPSDTANTDYVPSVEIRDRDRALLAIARVHWLTGPERTA